MKINFNKPYLTGKEAHYLYQAVYSGHISGNGNYTKKCQAFFEEKWGFKKTLLTTSCTDALEMCALLLDIKKGDEVIVPSYTFVSSALAFERQGAQIVFADSRKDHPGISEIQIESLITPKTKAIVVVHYAGVAVDMDIVMALAEKHNLFVIEDAAQAIDSCYKGKSLGSIGHFGTFSFHETKNIQCGEGGLLAINDEQFIRRAEIIWEKGTNRAEFFRGEANKYGWKDTGSSFLPSELNASFLYAQLENIDDIQKRRKDIWLSYYNKLLHLEDSGNIKLPSIPDFATNNAHMFYMVLEDEQQRSNLIRFLAEEGIKSVFHYLSLHKSDYYLINNELIHLPYSDLYSNCLVRLPLFYELDLSEVYSICSKINSFFLNE
ncbi:dTDP-4-amino-4,6-dideoxygalactose transaminase [Flammeovirga sp. EKP202]|uniref:dTDP-4-amino-4,6-dideoxygalactose transaminase n=1 Tax=Flammeovirga sp. EKP202 TaxID=2770592 RepID=UPI00165FED3E|nr:dTDP-4-amino-4,6-dideoxygalactose transaminase [Flammeovirga sp. EKP202]MBD0400820.1 dTDP-4-amino-4,6-dideoxygalactose transaminase [Flammeovirga sp. EKP202]